MSDLSTESPIEEPPWKGNAETRCVAHKKNGDRCRRQARRGASVCDWHGAKAPAVQRRAKLRLEEASDRIAKRLLKMATDDDVPPAVALSAIKDALDRAGVTGKTQVEVEVGVKPYEGIAAAAIVPMTRAESRAQRGLPHIDAEVIDGSPQADAQPPQETSETRPRSASPTSSPYGGANGPTPENATAEPHRPPWSQDAPPQPGKSLMTLEEANRIAADANRQAGVYRHRK